ncbi:MAG: LysR family transcriptional regulator [Hyalangium sp.]|uniref:helix-turn-helix domain-containing protein n=1 Tax=Hyalangium sp. TaxID=2028555 RepID=UPI00389A7762
MGALDDMALFAALARHGGIRKAAAELETQPSTVSRRLTALEKRLGVRRGCEAQGFPWEQPQAKPSR